VLSASRATGLALVSQKPFCRSVSFPWVAVEAGNADWGGAARRRGRPLDVTLRYGLPAGDDRGQAPTFHSEIITEICGSTLNFPSYWIPDRTFQEGTTLAAHSTEQGKPAGAFSWRKASPISRE